MTIIISRHYALLVSLELKGEKRRREGEEGEAERIESGCCVSGQKKLLVDERGEEKERWRRRVEGWLTSSLFRRRRGSCDGLVKRMRTRVAWLSGGDKIDLQNKPLLISSNWCHLIPSMLIQSQQVVQSRLSPPLHTGLG